MKHTTHCLFFGQMQFLFYALFHTLFAPYGVSLTVLHSLDHSVAQLGQFTSCCSALAWGHHRDLYAAWICALLRSNL